MAADSGLITLQEEPENLESPPSVFDSYLTPQNLFYVRNHFETPEVDVGAWRLALEGAVEQRRELTYADILSMPARKVTATLECAGNGRTFLPQKSKGVQWHLGAVGSAEWTGVSLTTVLAEAGMQQEAREIVLVGADSGEVDEDPKTPGVIDYARSLPLSKALSADVVLAYRMNDQELSRQHGFPLRAVVPGWYGMASVKWLRKIVVTTHPFAGYFESFEYSRWERSTGLPSLMPLTAGEVKSEIWTPPAEAAVKRGSICQVRGAAWAGESEIATVEVSADEGNTWTAAQLLDTPRRYCWVRWEYDWSTPEQAGRATLLARATDQDGRSQPFEHSSDERHYSIHHVLPVPVRVE